MKFTMELKKTSKKMLEKVTLEKVIEDLRQSRDICESIAGKMKDHNKNQRADGYFVAARILNSKILEYLDVLKEME